MCLAALSIASTLMSAASAASQASAQASAYQDQANQARANANAAETQAANAANKGAQQESRIAKQTKATVGKQTSMYGASNIDTASGSALDVINNTENEGLADQLQTRKNAANEAYAYQTEAVNQKNAASTYEKASKNTLKAGKISAFTTLLGGASSTSSNYNQYKSSGGTSSFWNW